MLLTIFSCNRTSQVLLFTEDSNKKKGLKTFYIIVIFLRIEKYKSFKENKHRVMVATDVMGRGIDMERVNLVFNYDIPMESD